MTSDLHQQPSLGSVAPDYAFDRFIAFSPTATPLAASPPPTPRRIVTYQPPPPPIAIDELLAETLEKHLKGVKVTSLLKMTTRAALLFAMRRTQGNQSRAAGIVGIGRYTFGKWCVKHAIDRQLFGGRATADSEDAA